MRILHSVSTLEAESSGVTYVVKNLCRALAGLGQTVELLSLGCQAKADQNLYSDKRYPVDMHGAWPLSKLGFSRAMRGAVFRSEANVFHTHGLWMFPNTYPSQAARKLGRPLVLSPHGMLGAEALQFSRLKKRVFLELAQGPALSAVKCLHATAVQEYNEIRTFGLKQPVAIIPNGIDITPLPPVILPPAISRVVSLGRIHPKKGLDRLIRAWALIEEGHPNWQLDIIGPSEGGHGEALARLSRQLGLHRVNICGPVFGRAKLQLLADAELFALPTLNENFAMTVAESLVCGTPVISTKGAPWAGLKEHRCGWWIDHGVEAMAAALREAMALRREERRTMGLHGRAWMERDYGWDKIAQSMLEVYTWMISGGAQPDCVRTD